MSARAAVGVSTRSLTTRNGAFLSASETRRELLQVSRGLLPNTATARNRIRLVFKQGGHHVLRVHLGRLPHDGVPQFVGRYVAGICTQLLSLLLGREQMAEYVAPGRLTHNGALGLAGPAGDVQIPADGLHDGKGPRALGAVVGVVARVSVERQPGRPAANSRAAARMSSAGTQANSATASGEYSCTCARSGPKPTVQASTNWWS